MKHTRDGFVCVYAFFVVVWHDPLGWEKGLHTRPRRHAPTELSVDMDVESLLCRSSESDRERPSDNVYGNDVFLLDVERRGDVMIVLIFVLFIKLKYTQR